MKIKLIKEVLIDDRTHAVGEVVEVETRRAAKLIKSGIAVPAVEGETVETADAPKAPETRRAPK